ncbi:MAG: TVP38/TMEM64 family protein [Oscillatoriales cyanobacterium RM2_1_1]|nr:TVP38/TMEM64 family protein [Oscillatoriales cyanobacterium SM2_3_0]NJO44309.1 TVP38/TMEM64 family protein [Oscillatoriales cyanobacterium RM2_1_1]
MFRFRDHRTGLIRLGLGIAFLSCGGLIYHSPWRDQLNPQNLGASLQVWGAWTIAGFIIIYSLLTLVGIPATPLTIAGGLVFGWVWGTVWTVVGATLGAIAAFYLARYLLRDWFEKRFGQHRALLRLQRITTKRPLKCVLLIRLAPICPFNLANFLFGLTSIDGKSYALGTFIGIIPGSLAYIWLGIAGEQAIQQGDRLAFGLGLGFFLLLCILPMALWKNRP